MNSSEIPSTAIVSVEPNLPVDHDVLARRRDNQGNRLPSRSAYDIPAAGELPLDQSQIQFLLNRLDEERPLHASWLRYFYHEKLHPAHTRFKKVLEEEQAQLAKRQQRYQEHNDYLEREVQRIQAERQAALAVVSEELSHAKLDLKAAHDRASRCLARVGQSYDPDKPADESVLIKPQTSSNEEADRLSLPHYEKESRWHLLPWPVTLLFSLVVGLLVGVSLGVVGGFFEPDNLTRKLVIVGFCVLVGIGVALFSRYAVLVAFKLCGEQSLLNMSPTKKAIVYSLAFLVLGAIFVSDMFVERQGILKLAQINNSVDSLGGSGGIAATPEWIYYLVAAVVMFGYLVYSAYEGFIKGRKEVINNRLLRSRLEQDEVRLVRHRSRPEIQEALQSVAAVRECQSRMNSAKEEHERLAQPFDKRIEDTIAQRQPVPLEMEAHQLHRIQDAYDNLLGAQKMFDSRVEHLMKQIEPHSTISAEASREPWEEPSWDTERQGVFSRAAAWVKSRFARKEVRA